ncbi:hypothetical protein H4582DRAFT_2073426 [Lactarius indigo]|nr:hypothetical protein H4582DRAFT_2073426 [Lactarius indigo]
MACLQRSQRNNNGYGGNERRRRGGGGGDRDRDDDRQVMKTTAATTAVTMRGNDDDDANNEDDRTPIATATTKSFSDFVVSFNPLSASAAQRSFANGIPATRYLPAIFDAFSGQTLNAKVVMSIEPFDNTLLSHETPSAYPPDCSQEFSPSTLNYLWTNASLDATVARALRPNTDVTRAAVPHTG